MKTVGITACIYAKNGAFSGSAQKRGVDAKAVMIGEFTVLKKN